MFECGCGSQEGELGEQVVCHVDARDVPAALDLLSQQLQVLGDRRRRAGPGPGHRDDVHCRTTAQLLVLDAGVEVQEGA